MTNGNCPSEFSRIHSLVSSHFGRKMNRENNIHSSFPLDTDLLVRALLHAASQARLSPGMTIHLFVRVS